MRNRIKTLYIEKNIQQLKTYNTGKAAIRETPGGAQVAGTMRNKNKSGGVVSVRKTLKSLDRDKT